MTFSFSFSKDGLGPRVRSHAGDCLGENIFLHLIYFEFNFKNNRPKHILHI